MLMLHNKTLSGFIGQEIYAAYHGGHPADLLLVCQGNQVLSAHKLVFAAASPLIRMLLVDTSIREGDVTTIHFPDISVQYFHLLLQFLYSGETWVPSGEMEKLHDLLNLLQMNGFIKPANSKNDTNLDTNIIEIEDENSTSSPIPHHSHADILQSNNENPNSINWRPPSDVSPKAVPSLRPATLPNSSHNSAYESSLNSDCEMDVQSDEQTARLCEIQSERSEKCFPRKRNHKKHWRNLKPDEKPFKCRLCSSNFSQKYNLLSHLSYRHRDVTNSLDAADRYGGCFCTLVFESRKEMMLHLSIYHSEMLVSKGEMVVRPAIDIARSIPKCEYCGKEFMLKANLEIHLRVHTSEKPFACRQCGVQFTQKKQLLVHLCSKLHKEGKLKYSPDVAGRFTCCFCPQYFETQQELMRHFGKEHNKLLLTQYLNEQSE